MHQHAGVHAHVARADDGTKMIELAKRDDWSDNIRNFIHRPQHNTNSEDIKLNVPADFAEKDSTTTTSTDSGSSDDSGVATVVSMVYVTMTPTFSGSVAGYSTASIAATSSSDTLSSITSSSAFLSASSASPIPSKGTPQANSRESPSAVATSTAEASSNASSQDMTITQSSSGMSDGAKAGLAFGIILAIALAAGLVFFCWRRNKKDTNREELNEKEQYNEKRSSFFGGSAPVAAAAAAKRQSADSDKSFGSVRTAATAPRLSLRPVTQFFPGFGEQRKSSSNVLGTAAPMSEKQSAWERRPQNSAENPFSDAAVLSEKQAQPSNPFEEGDGKAPSVKSNHSQKSSWEGSEPATPKSLHVGTAAAVPVAAMNAQSSGTPPVPQGPNNVHRVQLDFKPSMDDELELKSGQLVRMLHEYDDGWALCIRMDRSQQGVAPRTCLSKTPVKPRGPPSGGRNSPPGVRGPPPQGNMTPRPMTPTSQQGQTSSSELQSPTGGMPARKPVPGQAL